jgi:hypothetical protein
MALLYMVFTMPLYYAFSEYCSETGAAEAGVELIAEIFFFGLMPVKPTGRRR